MSLEPAGKIELAEESLRIGTREVQTGRVRVRIETDSFESPRNMDLEETEIEVRRIPIDRDIDVVPPPRQEGTTTILSVVEEILVVEKRLVLREEIHIHRKTTRTNVEVPATLRRQRAIVERFDDGGHVVATENLTGPPEAEYPNQPEGMQMTTTEASFAADNSLSAFFDTKSEAEQALERLRAAGITDANLRLTEGAQEGIATSDAAVTREKGFFEGLGDFFFPDEDRHAYAEGLSRGGFLLTVVNLPDDQRTEALDILDAAGAVNIDEREEAWRSEGWTGYGAERGLVDDTQLVADTERSAFTQTGATAETSVEASSSSAGTTLTGAGDAAVESIPVIEERLRVGKRDTSHGRVRVRSYIREKEASAEVELRNERVEIERRTVDRPLTDADNAFRDQVIEAEEHREEAVVAKEARVVEEIDLRKHEDTRKETITDTVRHTEVEVEDDRLETDGAPNRR